MRQGRGQQPLIGKRVHLVEGKGAVHFQRLGGNARTVGNPPRCADSGVKSAVRKGKVVSRVRHCL
jgi:hypothetical protein